MSVNFNVQRSCSCSCSVTTGSTAVPALRKCRLRQPGTATWQQPPPVALQPTSGWLQSREMRRLGSHTVSALRVLSEVPVARKRRSKTTACSQRPTCSFASVPASYDRLWGHVLGLPRCRAVGSAAADTGLSAGLPTSGHNRAQSPAASTASVSPQFSPQDSLEHDDSHPQPASLPVNNGHPPPTAAAAAATCTQANSGNINLNPATVGASKTRMPEADPADGDSGATCVDGMSDTHKFVFADEWGFTRVGGDLPEGTSPATFSDMFPDRFFAFDPLRVVAAIAVPLVAIAAGYGWLWYMHSICPAWQQLACAVLIGTAYTGLFKVAHECACLRFLPQSPRLQDILGLVLMLPSLYPFTSWRLHYIHHLAHLNMLGEDTFGWHPYSKLQLATEVILGERWCLALRRLVLATPFKLLASIGHWLHSFDGLDLKRFHKDTYWSVLAGWAVPILFLGYGVPVILEAFGVSGFLSGYVLPWLVFHFWLSTLSLLQHTAPHIPFRAEGEDYDYGRATICGTVTVRLPRPLELLLNDANYALPQLVAPGMPGFHAREAYEYMRERLLPYLTEATLSMKLLTNHITKWQVYDEEKETYLPMDEVQHEVESDIAKILEEVEKAEMAKAAAGTSATEQGLACGAPEETPGQTGTIGGQALA